MRAVSFSSMKFKPFSLFSNTSWEFSFMSSDDNEGFHLSVEWIAPDEVMGIEFMGALVHSSGLSSDIRSTPISSDDTILDWSLGVWLSFTESNFSVITFTNNSSEDFTSISESKGESLFPVVPFSFPDVLVREESAVAIII